IEQREAAREQLAKDHALSETRRKTEADPARQLFQQPPDIALVLGIQAAEAVAHHDPIDRPAAIDGALLSLIPAHLAIAARLQDLLAVMVDAAEQVEVKEAVVQGRDQRIRQGMRQPRQRSIGTRRINDDEIAIPEFPKRAAQAVRFVVAPCNRAV